MCVCVCVCVCVRSLGFMAVQHVLMVAIVSISMLDRFELATGHPQTQHAAPQCLFHTR